MSRRRLRERLTAAEAQLAVERTEVLRLRTLLEDLTKLQTTKSNIDLRQAMYSFRSTMVSDLLPDIDWEDVTSKRLDTAYFEAQPAEKARFVETWLEGEADRLPSIDLAFVDANEELSISAHPSFVGPADLTPEEAARRLSQISTVATPEAWLLHVCEQMVERRGALVTDSRVPYPPGRYSRRYVLNPRRESKFVD